MWDDDGPGLVLAGRPPRNPGRLLRRPRVRKRSAVLRPLATLGHLSTELAQDALGLQRYGELHASGWGLPAVDTVPWSASAALQRSPHDVQRSAAPSPGNELCALMDSVGALTSTATPQAARKRRLSDSATLAALLEHAVDDAAARAGLAGVTKLADGSGDDGEHEAGTQRAEDGLLGAGQDRSGSWVELTGGWLPLLTAIDRGAEPPVAAELLDWAQRLPQAWRTLVSRRHAGPGFYECDTLCPGRQHVSRRAGLHSCCAMHGVWSVLRRVAAAEAAAVAPAWLAPLRNMQPRAAAAGVVAAFLHSFTPTAPVHTGGDQRPRTYVWLECAAVTRAIVDPVARKQLGSRVGRISGCLAVLQPLLLRLHQFASSAASPRPAVWRALRSRQGSTFPAGVLLPAAAHAAASSHRPAAEGGTLFLYRDTTAVDVGFLFSADSEGRAPLDVLLPCEGAWEVTSVLAEPLSSMLQMPDVVILTPRRGPAAAPELQLQLRWDALRYAHAQLDRFAQERWIRPVCDDVPLPAFVDAWLGEPNRGPLLLAIDDGVGRRTAAAGLVAHFFSKHPHVLPVVVSLSSLQAPLQHRALERALLRSCGAAAPLLAAELRDRPVVAVLDGMDELLVSASQLQRVCAEMQASARPPRDKQEELTLLCTDAEEYVCLWVEKLLRVSRWADIDPRSLSLTGWVSSSRSGRSVVELTSPWHNTASAVSSPLFSESSPLQSPRTEDAPVSPDLSRASQRRLAALPPLLRQSGADLIAGPLWGQPERVLLAGDADSFVTLKRKQLTEQLDALLSAAPPTSLLARGGLTREEWPRLRLIVTTRTRWNRDRPLAAEDVGGKTCELVRAERPPRQQAVAFLSSRLPDCGARLSTELHDLGADRPSVLRLAADSQPALRTVCDLRGLEQAPGLWEVVEGATRVAVAAAGRPCLECDHRSVDAALRHAARVATLQSVTGARRLTLAAAALRPDASGSPFCGGSPQLPHLWAWRAGELLPAEEADGRGEVEAAEAAARAGMLSGRDRAQTVHAGSHVHAVSEGPVLAAALLEEPVVDAARVVQFQHAIVRGYALAHAVMEMPEGMLLCCGEFPQVQEDAWALRLLADRLRRTAAPTSRDAATLPYVGSLLSTLAASQVAPSRRRSSTKRKTSLHAAFLQAGTKDPGSGSAPCPLLPGTLRCLVTSLHAGAVQGGKLPLQAAAGSRRQRALRLMLAAGVEVDALPPPPGEHATALQIASQLCDTEATSALLMAGADPTLRGGLGLDALHLGCMQGHIGTVEALLNGGADVSSRTVTWHSTPLHVAVRCGHLGVVRRLLQNGADPAAVDAHPLEGDRRGTAADARRPPESRPAGVTPARLARRLADDAALQVATLYTEEEKEVAEVRRKAYDEIATAIAMHAAEISVRVRPAGLRR
eukprot:TRINITY_DN26102_c0_g1_i1.p1 TRINITY_DN26102_c0_g1~~TRINITY_DN26102_c0_g1_i1.p1  ORF type:complete len:1418 (+),score=424.19 TRINITY_DN26102_c0_g1_i1:36-4256(+)